MPLEAIEFICDHELPGGGPSSRRVVGRCGETALRVGDVFHFVANRQADEPGGEPGPPPSRVQWRIAAIEAYGRELRVLDRGVTAALTLAGVVESPLPAGAVLRGRTERMDDGAASAEHSLGLPGGGVAAKQPAALP